MAPYKSRDNISSMEDPWAEPSNSIGSFDSSGNFIFTDDKKEPISQKLSKIPIQQSRLSSIISSKIITAESLEATLIQSSIGPEKEISVSIPFYNMWYYKDPSGTIQGPFPSEQMAHWSEAGYFDAKMLVRPDIESASSVNHPSHFSILSDFIPLSEWVSLYNGYLPWSLQARNIIYSVKQHSVLSEPVKLEPSTITTSKEVPTVPTKELPILSCSSSDNIIESLPNEAKRLISSSGTPNTSDFSLKEITHVIEEKQDKFPIKSTTSSTVSPTVASSFKGWKTASSMPVVPISCILQDKTKAKVNISPNTVKPVVTEAKLAFKQQAPFSWSSIASSGIQPAALANDSKPISIPCDLKPTTTSSVKIIQLEQSQSQGNQSEMSSLSLPLSATSQSKTKIVSKLIESQHETNNLSASLKNWVSDELSKLNIKNIDSSTLTNLLLPLTADQMKEILIDFISNPSDIDDFIVGFNYAILKVADNNGYVSTNSISNKKKDSKISNENDGFSVVTRKAKKPSTQKSPSSQIPPAKRIVGL